MVHLIGIFSQQQHIYYNVWHIHNAHLHTTCVHIMGVYIEHVLR